MPRGVSKIVRAYGEGEGGVSFTCTNDWFKYSEIGG